MNIKEINNPVRIFKSLADDTRLQIIRLLLKSDFCVGALARMLNTSKPAVSQHLKILREAGLVKGEKRGYWTHYTVEKELLKKAALELQNLSETGTHAAEGGYFICLRQQNGVADPERINTAGRERRILQMCEKCCEHPEKLKTKPGECTPEEVKECHGDVKEHPCECDEKK